MVIITDANIIILGGWTNSCCWLRANVRDQVRINN
jgi:hypothetical protein